MPKKKGLDMINSGIPGLDKILKGGIKRDSSIIVKGTPGTGKTVLALQFIYEGAKKGERGLFISLEESPQSLRDCAYFLGLDIEKYENNGMITFYSQPSSVSRRIFNFTAPLQIISDKNIKRVVLDSLSLFQYMYVAKMIDYERDMVDFIRTIKDKNVTFLATTQQKHPGFDGIEYQLEDFLFEGLIMLAKLRTQNHFERCITVTKMRSQSYSEDIYPFEIEKGGIKIYADRSPKAFAR